MKNIQLKILLGILCLIGYTHLPAQTIQTLPAVDGKVTYENLRLEKQGSQMVLTFDTRIADKALNNRQSWKVIPELIPAGTGKSTLYPSLLINGRQKERHYKRRMRFKNRELLANQPLVHTNVPQDEEQLIRYRAEIPYQSWMENASLTFHQILTSPREKKQLFTTLGIAKLTPEPKPEPITPPPPPVTVTPPSSKTLTINGEAHIQFPVGITDIYPAYMGNTHELEKIEKEIRRILQDDALTLVSIQLTGYASPEARYSTNARLSERRTKELKGYLVEKYGLPPEIIRVSNVPEDWKRLRELIEQSTVAERSRVLAIIDSDAPEDTKERQLRAMTDTWQALLSDYFPLLRRVDYQILYKKESTD